MPKALTNNQEMALVAETLAIIARGVALGPQDKATVEANIAALNGSTEAISEAAKTIANS